MYATFYTQNKWKPDQYKFKYIELTYLYQKKYSLIINIEEFTRLWVQKWIFVRFSKIYLTISVVVDKFADNKLD